jgi:hypothetical protein
MARPFQGDCGVHKSTRRSVLTTARHHASGDPQAVAGFHIPLDELQNRSHAWAVPVLNATRPKLSHNSGILAAA